MNEKEILKEELEWVKYRIKMLDIIEKKLVEMKILAENAKNNYLSDEEKNNINYKIQLLYTEIKSLDEESSKIDM